MKPIRNSVKAVILRDNHLLMIRCADEESGFYLLPGGGQRSQELMSETVVRECIEEIGCPVIPGPLLFVCEYVGERGHKWEKALHQIEFMFRCELPPGAEPMGGGEPDDVQIGVEWVSIERLDSLRYYPVGLAKALRDMENTPVYWGNVK